MSIKNKTFEKIGETYPRGAVTIIDMNDTECRFHSLGGGWSQRLPLDRFLELFRLHDEENKPKLEKGRFDLDGMTDVLDGYTYGFLWNGFEMPLFPKEEVLKLRKHMPIEYDEKNDEFIVDMDPTGTMVDAEMRYEHCKGQTHMFEGKPVVLYPIGDSWTWDKALDEDDEAE